MKRQAGAAGNEELDDYNDDEDNDNNGSSADNLQVFCCSATEYQKMKNLIANDGPSQVSRRTYLKVPKFSHGRSF